MIWWNSETEEAYKILANLDPEEIEWTDDVEKFSKNLQSAFNTQLDRVDSALQMVNTSPDIDRLVFSSLAIFAQNVSWSQVAERLMPISEERAIEFLKRGY